MAARNAASVLPLPVGAAIRVWLPARIAGHASACAGVGAAKVCRNQRATAGWNGRGWLMVPAEYGKPLRPCKQGSRQRPPSRLPGKDATQAELQRLGRALARQCRHNPLKVLAVMR